MISALLFLFTAADPFLPVSETPRWGFRDGIQIALHPGAIGTGGQGGPRGLLRVGYPIRARRQVSLINFIAVEPVVGGQRGYSELERSADGQPGKRITAGRVRREGRWLRVEMDVERFANGAHVRLEVTFDSTRPDEVELRAFGAPGSAAMTECALTATMGNYERLRRVRLADRVIESGALFTRFLPNGFTPDHLVRLSALARDAKDDVVVPATPDEPDARPLQMSLPKGLFWRYPGTAVTQYWRAPRGTFSPELHLRLNGRRTYWMTDIALPGGVAFENFELRDRFRSGQPFVFGVTGRTPEQLLAPAARRRVPPDPWCE